MIIACVWKEKALKHDLVGLQSFLKIESSGDKASGSWCSGNNTGYCRTWNENGESAILEVILFFLPPLKTAAIEMILTSKEASLYFCFNNLQSCLMPQAEVAWSSLMAQVAFWTSDMSFFLKNLSSEKAVSYFHRFVVPLCGMQSLFCFLHCYSHPPYFLYNVFSVFGHQ